MGGCYIMPAVPASDHGVRVRVEVGGEEQAVVLMDDLMEWVQGEYEKQGREIPFFHPASEPSTGKDMVIVDIRGLGPIPCRDIPEAVGVALHDLHSEDAKITRVGKRAPK